MVRPSDSVRLCGDGAGRASLVGARRRPFVVRRPYFRRGGGPAPGGGGGGSPRRGGLPSRGGAQRARWGRGPGAGRGGVVVLEWGGLVPVPSDRAAAAAGRPGVAPGVGGETAGNLSDPS